MVGAIRYVLCKSSTHKSSRDKQTFIKKKPQKTNNTPNKNNKTHKHSNLERYCKISSVLSSDVNGPRHANNKNISSSQSCNSYGFTYSSTTAETIGIPCFECTFFIPSTRCNSVFITLDPLPPISIHMKVFICDNCAKRSNFKIPFWFFFFWTLNHWLFISR